jgi:hypothetical protein
MHTDITAVCSTQMRQTSDGKNTVHAMLRLISAEKNGSVTDPDQKQKLGRYQTIQFQFDVELQLKNIVAGQ